MKKLIVLFCFCCLTLVGFAQSISGFVRDEVRPLMKDGKYDDALKKIDKYYSKNPALDSILMMKAGLQVYLGKTQDADATYKQMITKQKTLNNGTTLSLIAMVGYFFNEDYENKYAENKASIVYFLDRAEKEFPDDYTSYIIRAGMYEDAKEYEKAIEVSQKAFSRNQKFYEEEGINVARLCWLAGKKEQAYQELEKYLKVAKPENKYISALIKRYAWAKSDRNWELARISINEIIRLEKGENIESYIDKSHLFYAMNRLDSLKTTLEIIENKEPTLLNDDTFLQVAKNLVGFEGLTLSSSMVLKYEVDPNFGEPYDFQVSNIQPTFEKNTLTRLAFNWEMPEKENMKGKISLNNMQTAVEMKNYFSADNPDEKYNNETTVWVSNKIMETLRNDATVEIVIDGTNDQFDEPNHEIIEITVDGEIMEVPVFEVYTDTGATFKILDQPNNPLILEMNLGSFSISIKEITTK